MMLYFAPVLLLCVCSVDAAARTFPGIQPSEEFHQSTMLDTNGDYILYWNYNDTHVTFEAHVRTKGWIGLGISSNGNMYPADVVVGWLANGTVHFADRHTTGHVAPVKDQSQDWHVLMGEENEFGTVLKFVRPIDTCDSAEDEVIQEGTVRLIYAFNPVDPVDDDDIRYHGTHRGTKSVSLLSKYHVPQSMPSDLTHYDFLNRNLVVPSGKTTYWCQAFQMPDIGGKRHLIKYEPVITPGNDKLVHHILLYRCKGIDPSLHGQSGDCYGKRPKGFDCSDIFLAWAIGGQEFYFPDHTGLSVGASDDPSFYIMETHYDNPTQRSGVIDNSGLRITMTTTLRPNEVGTMMIGMEVNFRQVVPPFEPAFVSSGYCGQFCMEKGLSQASVPAVNVIGAVQHAHLLAERIQTRHFRNGTELTPIMDDPNYDFNFQEMRLLKKEAVVKPGDSLRVDCTYDSTKRQRPTLGGLSTQEEMCLTFIFYYPKIDLKTCTSLPLTEEALGVQNEHDAYMQLVSMDWTNKTVRDHFTQRSNQATQYHRCFGQNLQPEDSYQNFKEQPPKSIYQLPKPACGAN